MTTTDQILWGKQPLKDIPWIKLCAYTHAKQMQYAKEGWTTAIMDAGEHPELVGFRRDLPAPQAEMGFANDSFTLITETAQDGARITEEQRQQQERAERAAKAQLSLF